MWIWWVFAGLVAVTLLDGFCFYHMHKNQPDRLKKSIKVAVIGYIVQSVIMQIVVAVVWIVAADLVLAVIFWALLVHLALHALHAAGMFIYMLLPKKIPKPAL